MTKRRSNAERSESTRRALIAEARRSFARDGFAKVSLAEVAQNAAVTKGALYHHFESKVALFRAVLAEVQADVAQRVEAAADKEAEPWNQLVTGCRTFITATSEPEVQRIMLVDGPAVIGWSEWRALDEASSARLLGDALSRLIASGDIAPQPVEPLTHLLSGAMNEAALWLAGSANRERTLTETLAALTRLLESLRRR